MIAEADYLPTAAQIDAVLTSLPVFERENFVPSEVKAPPGQFPYHVFAEELDRFVQAAYAGGFVYSFDWGEWQEEAERFYEQPELLRTADIRIIRKLLTCHIRQERFCEGHLPEMVKRGHIAAILRQLKALRYGTNAS